MWDKIREHLENGDHESARSLLDQEKSAGEPCDDTFAILEASVCEAEQDREGMFDAIAGGLSWWYVLIGVLVCYIAVPAAVALGVSELMRKFGWIRKDDMKLPK